MTMFKAVAVSLLLVVALSGFTYGAFHFRAFLSAGGTPNTVLARHIPEQLRPARARTVRGFGLFWVTVGLMLLITAIWGPVVI